MVQLDRMVAASDEAQGAGAVMLVAGYGAFAQAARAAATVALLGRIGETFLDGRPGWRIQRLAPGEAETPNRVELCRAIDRVVALPTGPCVLVLVGAVVSTALGPSMVCAPEHDTYPEDTTLALSWIGQRLLRYRGETLLCMLIADSDERDRRRWLTDLTHESRGLVVVASAAADALGALLDGLSGEAFDPATGTVTARELGRHLARRLTTSAIRPSSSALALVSPPPVATRHDPRLSRLIAGTGVVVDTADLIGTVLPGRFRVESELGRGGFGIVYRAHHDLLRRDFAIKVVTLPNTASLHDVEAFLQEIRCVAGLDHRNIVRVHFADMLGRRRLFFAMELLAGRDLQRVLDEDGAIPSGRARALITQLLEGLSAAHDAGLVHADIKPANLIVVNDDGSERLVLVDFGLACLHGRKPVRAIGGTAAFMAPEQQRGGLIDARADLYAAARVAVALWTGRVDATVDAILDPVAQAALARALADDPDARFASAAEMSAALHGSTIAPVVPSVRSPFRHAAPFTEQDRDDFHGRERDIEAILDATLFRSCVVYTAPSGTGKTSLLRAGLMPRLTDRGVRVVYLACRASSALDLIALSDRTHSDGSRVVVIIDQVEAMLIGEDQASVSPIARVLELAMAPGRELAVVLSVREEFLARLLEFTQHVVPSLPVLHLGPLNAEAARNAIVLTLQARRLAIEPALLDVLIADLEQAARAMAAQLGRANAPVVYPPHLQLAGAVLHEALTDGATTLTLDVYRRLGGLAHILDEHLHRVLEGELSPARTAIARAVLPALVTAAHTRNARSRSELIAIARAPGRSAEDIADVIGFLCNRGLLVELRGHGADSLWELAHDSLVPRIEAWVTATDLARLRALELIRHHLRRSEHGRMSLLGVGELREVARSTRPADVSALDAEWSGRVEAGEGDHARSATTLLALSRRAVRARRLAGGSTLTIALVVVVVLAARWQSERAQREYEAMLRDRDIGSFTLELSAFDWDPAMRRATNVALDDLPELTWSLHKPDGQDPSTPGVSYTDADMIRTRIVGRDPLVRVIELSVRGGAAVLVIQGRGRRRPDGSFERCAETILPVQRLPGYSAPGPRSIYRVRIPTCAATRAGTVAIAPGPFVAGGAGEPPVSYASELPPEQVIELAGYAIDRTEVTNAAFRIFASMMNLHAVPMPDYPKTSELLHAGDADHPVSFVNWPEARAYCRYLGKDLPTLDQWDRALRGGIEVDGLRNDAPRRTFAWAGDFAPAAAALPDVPARHRPFPVGSFPRDVSPEGVADLSGNVQEWVLASPPEDPSAPLPATEQARAEAWAPRGRFRITRGCNWDDAPCGGGQSVIDFTALPNQRAFDLRNFTIGFRCAAVHPMPR